MRKMASVRKIDGISPIDGADSIETAIVGGWKVVVKKGEYTEGDLAVYCEIDSWIPTKLAPFLSRGKEPREFEGIKGERLRTVKLRSQISQGLLLPVAVAETQSGNPLRKFSEGDDVSELLNIKKWEMPVPAQLAGQVKGNFPSLLQKTDQERIQNLTKEIKAAFEAGLEFEITEKLEGSSMTVYRIGGVFGVCSRNLDLKRDENNTFWATAIANDIEQKLIDVFGDKDIAIQGELIGPGIQQNVYKLTKHEFHVFDIFDVHAGTYLYPEFRHKLVEKLGLKHVPVIALNKDLGTGEVDYILEWAEGKSILNDKQEREGIVFKEMRGGMTFKAISNAYLLKNG